MFNSNKPNACLSNPAPSKILMSDTSSLAGLKAELNRKRQEAKLNKGKKKEDNKPKVKNLWSKKNPGVSSRSFKDGKPIALKSEKEAQVKAILTQKAMLYDKLKSGLDIPEKDRFMVNFQCKDSSSDEESINSEYPPTLDDNEMIEYTDALGRTRTCMRKDLKKLKKQDKSLKEIEKERRKNRNEEEPPDLMSEDMRRELLRKKWEEEEEANVNKSDIHYQDILFDEARTHGAGFYKFDTDAATRAAQQEELAKLHEQTEKERAKAEKKRAERKAELEERLRTIKNNKRIKMGLPPIEKEEEEKAKAAEEAEEKKKNEAKSLEESILDSLREIREKERELERKKMIRDWDLGKKGMPDTMPKWVPKIKERKVMTQEEWVKERRTLRPNEFAPPSAYDSTSNKKTNSNKNSYNSVAPPDSMSTNTHGK